MKQNTLSAVFLTGLFLMTPVFSSVEAKSTFSYPFPQFASADASTKLSMAGPKRFGKKRLYISTSKDWIKGGNKTLLTCGNNTTQTILGHFDSDDPERHRMLRVKLTPNAKIVVYDEYTNYGGKVIKRNYSSLCDIPIFSGEVKDCIPSSPKVPDPPCITYNETWDWKDYSAFCVYYPSYRAKKRLSNRQLVSKKKAFKIYIMDNAPQKFC
jgi:hypothetical protein